MTLYSVDSPLVSFTCDIFEWLAVMEAISFEDFEFAAIFDKFMPQAFGISHSRLREFRLTSGKRFFLIHASAAGMGYTGFRVADIACIYSSAPLCAGAVSGDAVRCFNALAAQGGRTCLLYTCEDPALGVGIVEETGAADAIEWATPSLDATYQWRSGLIFSSNWKKAVPRHTLRTIGSYMQTRARSASAPVLIARTEGASPR